MLMLRIFRMMSLTLGLLLAGCGPGSSSEIKLTGGHASLDANYLAATIEIWGNCTAAKIGKRLFLTAAHCVIDFNSRNLRDMYRSGSKIYITNFKDPSESKVYPWNELTIAYTNFSSTYLNACRTLPCPNTLAIDGADVAVFKVEEETPSIPSTWIDWSRDTHVGESVVLTGYGCENGLDGPSTQGKGRFKFQVTQIAAPSLLDRNRDLPFRDRILSWNYITPGLSASSAAASLCPGDSGGPLYRNDGSGAIVGINSYYSFEDRNPGVSFANWHTRLARNDIAWWLYDEVKKGSD